MKLTTGHGNHIALSAVSIDADEDIKKLDPYIRNCLFSDETQLLKLGLYKRYSQSNCFLECSILYAQNSMTSNISVCTPWYLPFPDKNHRMCNPWEAKEFIRLFRSINYEKECDYCLPDCRRVLYKHRSNTEPLRNCKENNFGVSNLCLHNNIAIDLNYWGSQALKELEKKNEPQDISIMR